MDPIEREATLLRSHIAGDLTTPASGDRFSEAYRRFLSVTRERFVGASNGPFSRYIADRTMRSRWELYLLDVWTAVFDRNSALRHKLTLSLALAECDPELQAAFSISGGSRRTRHWQERIGLVRDLAVYGISFIAANLLVVGYAVSYLGGRLISRAAPLRENILKFAPEMFDNSDPRVSNAAEEAPVMVAMALRLRPQTAMDVGTGSGFIAISLAETGIRVTASDFNPAAIEVTSENAAGRGVRLTTVLSDLFAGIAGRFDVILFNPPLIPTRVAESSMRSRLNQWVRKSRPLTWVALRLVPLFLRGARQRLIMRFLSEAGAHLNPRGSVIIYITPNEARWISSRLGAWHIAEKMATSFGLVVTRLVPAAPTSGN